MRTGVREPVPAGVGERDRSRLGVELAVDGDRRRRRPQVRTGADDECNKPDDGQRREPPDCDSLDRDETPMPT